MQHPRLETLYRNEAETSVIGSAIIDADCIGAAMDVLTADDFFVPEHRTIFEGICDIWLNQGTFDLVLLKNYLIERNKLDEIGGVDYLKKLALTTPSSANLKYYANIVKEKSQERSLIDGMNRLSDTIDKAIKLDEKIEAVQNFAMSLSGVEKQDNVFHVRDFADAAQGELENPQEGIGSGFNSLDQKTGGFLLGELIIIAARPSMGKTSLAVNLALHQAEDDLSVLLGVRFK